MENDNVGVKYIVSKLWEVSISKNKRLRDLYQQSQQYGALFRSSNHTWPMSLFVLIEHLAITALSYLKTFEET